jgi:hypothetical protein
MKNINVETNLLKKLVMGLIIREFGSIEIFNQEFQMMAPKINDIPITKNPIITIKQFTDEVDQVAIDGDWQFHICVMWKLINELEMI